MKIWIITLLFTLLLISCGDNTGSETKDADAAADQDQVSDGDNEITDDPNDPVITFKDPNFERCVMDNAFLKQKPVHLSDMKSITNGLACEGYNISDISELEYVPETPILRFNDNQITSIAPLANLTKLRELYIDNNLVEDTTPLQNCTELEILSAQVNKITNLNGIKMLGKLKKANLWKNNIEKLINMSNLKSLTVLDVNNNNLSSIEGIGGAPALLFVDISTNKITEINEIKTLLSMQSIWFDDNCIVDFSPIEYLKEYGKLTEVKGNTPEQQQNCAVSASVLEEKIIENNN